MTTTVLPAAAEYRRAADAMRADARSFMAIAASAEPQPHYLTFGPALVNQMRCHYEQMADLFVLAAEQAEQLAKAVEG